MTTISVAAAENYASSAGFSNTIKVSGTQYTQLQTIVGIAIAESGLDPNAFNASDPNGGSYGILQINGFWFSHGISAAGAKDPQTAFNFAYRTISAHGTNFSDWSTFTNGSYKNHISTVTNTDVMTLPKNGWWTFSRIDNYGAFPDTQGNFAKPDSNIILPAHYPLVAILPGTVTGVNGPQGQVQPWGATVTVKLDKPLNSLATHYAMLHMESTSVKVGQHVQPGDKLGVGGGNITAGSAPASVGFALCSGDNYGNSGNEWTTYYQGKGVPQLNPVSLLDSAKSGTLTFSGSFNASSGSGGNGTFTGLPQLLHKGTAKISPNDSVAHFFFTIDQMMRLENPIPDPNQVGQISGPGFSIPNPLEWTGDLIYNLGVDYVAFQIRAFIVLLGVYIVFKSVNSVMNITGTIGSVVGTAGKLAALGA